MQDDMSKVRSVCRDWEFVSKGTEISLGKFVPEETVYKLVKYTQGGLRRSKKGRTG